MVLATLGYLQKGGETLMIHFTKEGMSKDKWNGVGGKFEPGESPEECFTREAFEETGLKIKNPKVRGFLVFPKFYKGEDWNVFILTANEFSGELIPENREGSFHWINNNELKNLDLWDDDKYWFHLIHQEKFFTGRLEFENGKVTEAHLKLH